jgi:hypothetical protein
VLTVAATVGSAAIVPYSLALTGQSLTELLNGIAGLVFGWLYWRNGLVAAMVAHTSADVVLHVLSRLVLPV